MKQIPILITVATLLWGNANAAPSKPNILLILTDDLGYGDVGCYNPESKVPTPRIDRLAREGMRFTDAHSPSTVCTPTRYSIMTGRMAFRTGRHIVFQGAGGPSLLEDGRLTVPIMLKEKGYRTAKFGKWHIGLTFLDSEGNPIHDNTPAGVERIDYSRAIPDAPIHRGFDEFFGTACCPTTDWLYAFIDGDRIPVPPEGMVDQSKFPQNPYTEDFRDGALAPDFDIEEVDMIFLQKSLDFLDAHAKDSPDKPFFLFHSAQAVHLPSIPGKAFQGITDAGPHGDFIAQTDHIVGTLLDKLEEHNMAEDTLVIFTSDNGPEVAAIVNMRKDHQHDGARPWRGIKRDQWEGGHRVPMIVKWPAKMKAGTVSDQTISLTDLMATFAAITGYQLPNSAAEDSYDILPVLLGEDGGEPLRPHTLHQTWGPKYAIRVGQWKYIDHQGSGGNDYHRWEGLDAYILPDTAPDAPGQLYDLENDSGETTNLYFKHPERVKKMKELLDQSIVSGRSAPIRSEPQSLFNGKDLAGWEGPPEWWSVVDGVLTTESTPEKPCKKSNYLVWTGGQPADFQLDCEFRISADANSGIQIRSETRPDFDTWGYQADMTGDGALVGFLYHHAIGLVAGRGEIVTITPEGEREVERFAEADQLLEHYNKDDWNHYRITCQGPEISLYINGELMCRVTDHNPATAAKNGIIALQMHAGPPMKAEFRNIFLIDLAVTNKK